MSLTTWFRRKAESIANEFENGKRDYESAHPRETANARTESGIAEPISAAECLHTLIIWVSGKKRCQNCGSQHDGIEWHPPSNHGKSGTRWAQSSGHPTKEEWAEPAALPGTGVVFVTHGPNGPMFIERDATGKVIAQRGATGAERRNQHVAGLRGGK